MLKRINCALFLIPYLLTNVSCKPADRAQQTKQCGYDSCPATSPDKLNIHIVPHSHDDVGWLKTIDQYYYGSQTLTQRAGVQYILDSVVEELLHNPKRRFVYVESAFFFKWWSEQTEELQDKIKQLVNEGRLEFLGGAWSMNDEATTHYQSIIDQFTLGLRQLNETFGECGRPRVAWQIDPFGHSREMASMFAQMGFDGLFFARLDHAEKTLRLVNKTAEMIWSGSDNLGSVSDLFTGILYNHYSSPPGFCFDVLCTDEPIIDGKHSPDNNVDRKIQTLAKYLEKMSQWYRTNHLLVPMGDDFHYQNAKMVYKNLDKLIKYTNERQTAGLELNLIYSTPSCYLKSLHNATTTAWPTKSQDFFPYSSDATAFWTGYFTSRPTLKRFERVGNHFLQICKQLTAASASSTVASYPDGRFVDVKSSRRTSTNLQSLQEAMGIMQHHDAITGTEKAAVACDYARLLSAAIDGCGQNVRQSLNGGVQKEGGQLANFEFESCLGLNISSCQMSENSDKFMVTVYNVLGRKTSQFVRIPIQDVKYIVKDHRGREVESQRIAIPEPVRKLNYRFSVALMELVFLAKDVPANGFRSYYIEMDMSDESNMTPEIVLIRKPRETSEETLVQIDETKLKFDSQGRLSMITLNGITRKIQQDFFYYHGAFGNNQDPTKRSSGAYVFRPNGTANRSSDDIETYVVKGPLVNEVHQIFNSWISQVIRIYKAVRYIEFEWLVGPIPTDDGIGREVITRFTSDIESGEAFYTDSNGRETLKRVRNKRPDYDPQLVENIAGNYYPVTTKIAIEDKDVRLAILTDRAQGGSSLESGSIELMIHRRLLYDDGFGVNEPLDTYQFGKGVIARGKHYLMIGTINSDIRKQERNIQLEKTLPLWLFFSNVESMPVDEWTHNFIHEKSLWPIELPSNIHLMTLEPAGANKLLLRFEHILEKTDDPITINAASSSHPNSRTSRLVGDNDDDDDGHGPLTSSPPLGTSSSSSSSIGVEPITFDIGEFLKRIGHTKSIRRTALGGNLWLDDMKRLQFNKDHSNGNDEKMLANEESTLNRLQRNNETSITLWPMEIVTLIVERDDN